MNEKEAVGKLRESETQKKFENLMKEEEMDRKEVDKKMKVWES
jgi:hypothetical protein